MAGHIMSEARKQRVGKNQDAGYKTSRGFQPLTSSREAPHPKGSESSSQPVGPNPLCRIADILHIRNLHYVA